MKLTEQEIFEGIIVDLHFRKDKPYFGDLFSICGYENPNFPPTGNFNFHNCSDLQFSQIDDYFGVQTLTDEGDDVVIWLYPLVNGIPVHHNPGPFTGLRLEYNVLRNPVRRSSHLYIVIKPVKGNL